MRMKKWSFAALLLAALGILLAGLSSAPGKNWDSWGRHEKQYEELTAAILSGQLALPEEPAAFLAEMDNPYDPAARSIASDENGAYALIDTAYYKGNYYTYFGVTPVLLLYLPVYLFSRRILPTWIAVIFTALLCVPAAFALIRALCKRCFPQASAGTRALLSLLLVGTLGLPYLAAFCTTYSMPAVMGLLLTMLGLTAFLHAEREDGSLCRPLLVAGSVCLALTVGCRPVFAASFLLLFPIFTGAIRRGSFFRPAKTSVINTACVLLPALLLGSGFLLYNALRFDSPFEFGFRYLFTTRDLLHGSHGFGETLEGVRLLFFRIPAVHRVFPFMEIVDYQGPFQHVLYVEPLFGGLLPLHPLLPAAVIPGLFLAIFAVRSRKNEASVSPRGTRQAIPLPFLGLSSLAIGIVILVIDASIAGISQRYESDFALFFFIPAALLFLSLRERLAALNARRLLFILTAALLLITLAECFLSFASILCDGRYFAMRDWNPEAYNRIASFFPS
ncbi:MAG: hypothetical protein K6G16_07105 [Lachnospiraceae bacterium]|nr:hypothetical protein [Lachnospiraceae bacterium]